MSATPPPTPTGSSARRAGSGSDAASSGSAAAASDASDPEIGQVIDGRYRIVSMLGQGGMGAVYRAEHVGMGKMLAVKLLHPHVSSRRDAGARFQREAFASGRIDHPNCVAVSDFGVREDGSFYLVMELLQGESLRDLMDREGRIAWPRALHIARHVLRGLAHAHAQGIIHRDIKPENIFVVGRDDDPDFAKILDFGIAKLLAGGSTDKVTREGLVVGTPTYLSPEQAFGGELGAASDLYSLSVVLFEMLAGRPPFESPDPVALLTAHATQDIPALAHIAGDTDVPEAVELLLRRGLSKLRAQRIASADAYVEELDRVRAELGVAVHRAATAPWGLNGPPRVSGAIPAVATPLPFASTSATPRPTGTPMPPALMRSPDAPRTPPAPLASPHPSGIHPGGIPGGAPGTSVYPAPSLPPAYPPAIPGGPLSAMHPIAVPDSGAHMLSTPGSGVYLPPPTTGSYDAPGSGMYTGQVPMLTPSHGIDLHGLPAITGTVTLPPAELRGRRLRAAAVGVGLILFIGVIAALSQIGGGDGVAAPALTPGVIPDARAISDALPAAVPAPTPAPTPAPAAAAPVPATPTPTPTPQPAGEPAPTPVPADEPIAEPPPESPAEAALKAALHDLQHGKTCADRRAAVVRLRKLGDPRAIAPIKRARLRRSGGILGVGARNANACLRAEANAAITALSRRRR